MATASSVLARASALYIDTDTRWSKAAFIRMMAPARSPSGLSGVLVTPITRAPAASALSSKRTTSTLFPLRDRMTSPEPGGNLAKCSNSDASTSRAGNPVASSNDSMAIPACQLLPMPVI